MKALRRSIKGEKETKAHISIAPKSAIAIVPPKKVIRALYDYEGQTPQELSFSRGDFFHVIGRENDPDWYEACNPALPDARGLVPVQFFQALGRTERDSGSSQPETTISVGSAPGKSPDHDSGYGDSSTAMPTPAASQRNSKTGGKGGAMVYGIVMYDFQAERADELEAKAGEAIIVIAQSNPEWFVAKPIGRLGGPGLIPVSFIEIRDMSLNKAVPDPQEAIRRAGIPKVEEWKKMAAEYKNSSITLGKFEVGGGATQPQQSASQQELERDMARMSLQQGSNRTSHSNGVHQQQTGNGQVQRPMQPAQNDARGSSHLYAPVSAKIPRYCYAQEKYWFTIEAVLEDGRAWELSRYYEDFYDFQIALLTEFPDEAGNTGNQRTLPYMPGPVNYVTDAITEGRLHNLDAYVKNLLAQPKYISECTLLKQFFAPREGDTEIDPAVLAETDTERTSRVSEHLNGNGNGNSHGALAPPQPNGGQLQVTRQDSAISQPPQASVSPGIQQAGSAIKVKLSFNGDLIAIRVPADIQFRDLHQRISERLKLGSGVDFALSYKDEVTGDKLPMVSNNDLDVALQRNEKLLLYVE